jgi:hypothetical protein
MTKYLREINLKEKRVIWVHSFRRFSPWLLGLRQGRTSWQRVCGRAKLLMHVDQEAKKENGGSQEQDTLFKGMPLVTYFLQLGPTS